jgi:glutathione S-transferase
MPALYMGWSPEKFGYAPGSQNTEEGKEVIKRLRTTFVNEHLPMYMKFLTATLKKNGGRFLLGNEVSIVDLVFLPQLRYFKTGKADHVPMTCLDEFSEINNFIDAMMEIPQIKSHYAKLHCAPSN